MVSQRDTANTVELAAGYVQFCCGVIDVVGGLVPAVKPQTAFFEQIGPAGMAALAEVIRYAQQKGLLVILDGKRNDIGSTAAAYAQGFLGRDQSAWGADALTVSPYLGEESLKPFVDVATERDAGVFVLVKTSNPGGGMFQDLAAAGRPLYRHVAEYVEGLASDTAGTCGYGVVGAVVGATYPEQLAELRAEMPHSWFLVPGFGSQGGTAADVAGAFDRQGSGAVINNSRGIIFAHARSPYAEQFGPSRWQEAVEAATREMIEQLRADTPAGRLGKQ
jgi:orotidine-5'-phosphate decarboxylase